MSKWGKRPPEEIRLPEVVFVTPSKFNPWRGRRRGDDRFTIEQQSEMFRRGIDADTVAFVVVRQTATFREYYVPVGQSLPVYVMPCPILREIGADKLEVIAPMGSVERVGRDGSIAAGRRK